jgi:hypothetical protein
MKLSSLLLGKNFPPTWAGEIVSNSVAASRSVAQMRGD